MRATGVILVGVFVWLTACGGEEPARKTQDEDIAQFTAAGRMATNRMQLELKQALSAAMREGGASHALGVCRSTAPEVAKTVSEEVGLRVWRVSERNRNPQNTPTEAQRGILRHFATYEGAKDTVIVEADAPTYMRAIRIGADLCLACHGAAGTLDPQVEQRLAELYPDDRATGFSRGDLRGAFVVQRVAAD